MANTIPHGLQTVLPGTRFQPTKIMLVSFYLANKIFDRQSETEAAFIPDHNLYGDQEPWEIFKLYAPASDDDDAVKGMYFFTHLKKISMQGHGISRTVGKGTWHAEGKADYYEVEVEWLTPSRADACFRRYSYRNEDSDHHKRWTLHEYSCSAISDDVVICILRKNADKALPGDVPTPTLKMKSGVCPIATEEPKRMRFKAEIVESPPTNDNTEIIPATASAVEDYCNTVDQTATFMVPSYSSTVENVVGFDFNLSNGAGSYNHQKDNYYAMFTDVGARFINLWLNSEYLKESATNYNFEVSPATASGVEEQSFGYPIWGWDGNYNLYNMNGDQSSNISSTAYFMESATNYNFEVSPATASGVEERSSIWDWDYKLDNMNGDQYSYNGV